MSLLVTGLFFSMGIHLMVAYAAQRLVFDHRYDESRVPA
jgi:hypothetical protein